MQALENAYSVKGEGRLYWCGYGGNIPEKVKSLINLIRSNGREAYFVRTDGFDKTILNICQFCFDDDSEMIKEIEKIKKTNNINIKTLSFNPEKRLLSSNPGVTCVFNFVKNF